MPLLSIRVTETQKIELEERSARFGGNVSEYAKEVLFGTGHANAKEIIERLDNLSTDLSAAVSQAQNRASSSDSDSTVVMLSELLIMMRLSLSPEKMRVARAELDRLELPSWEPKMPKHGKNHG